MKRLLTILLLSTVWILGVPLSGNAQKSNVRDQKKELEKIQKDVSRSKQRLDSLKREENRVQKELSEYDQKISSQQKVIGRLGSQLQQLQKEIGAADKQLTSGEQALEQSQTRYLANVRQLYLTIPRQGTDFIESPQAELDAQDRIIYLTALVSFESGNVSGAQQYLADARSQLDALAGRQNKIERLKQQREVSYALDQSRKQRRQKQLDRLRRMKKDEFDKIVVLQQSAEEMEQILTRLANAPKPEVARKTTSPKAEPTESFAVLKGGLPSPFKGDITVPFGSATDPVTNLKSFSPGIAIKGRANGVVGSVGAGTVAYTGSLRGYGEFVIIDHDGTYFTTYAGLGQITVENGQTVKAGEKIGLAGADGVVRFELRKGRQALDPVEWIRLDAF